MCTVTAEVVVEGSVEVEVGIELLGEEVVEKVRRELGLGFTLVSLCRYIGVPAYSLPREVRRVLRALKAGEGRHRRERRVTGAGGRFLLPRKQVEE